MVILTAFYEFDSLFGDILTLDGARKTAEVSLICDEVVFEIFGKFLNGAMSAICGVAAQYPVFSGYLFYFLAFDFLKLWSCKGQGFDIDLGGIGKAGWITEKYLIQLDIIGRNDKIRIGGNRKSYNGERNDVSEFCHPTSLCYVSQVNM